MGFLSTKPTGRASAIGRRTRARHELGQSAAELAMLLPLLLLLLIGIIEVNAGLNSYITVTNAARDGARLGSKSSASATEIETLVKRDLGRLPNAGANSTVTVSHPTIAGVNSVRVRTCYDHHTFVHVPIVMPDTISMCSQTTMPALN